MGTDTDTDIDIGTGIVLCGRLQTTSCHVNHRRQQTVQLHNG
jgi:hypothetical protein